MRLSQESSAAGMQYEASHAHATEGAAEQETCRHRYAMPEKQSSFLVLSPAGVETNAHQHIIISYLLQGSALLFSMSFFRCSAMAN